MPALLELGLNFSSLIMKMFLLPSDLLRHSSRDLVDIVSPRAISIIIPV